MMIRCFKYKRVVVARARRASTTSQWAEAEGRPLLVNIKNANKEIAKLFYRQVYICHVSLQRFTGKSCHKNLPLYSCLTSIFAHAEKSHLIMRATLINAI